MNVDFTCWNCGEQFTASVVPKGSTRCPTCRRTIGVPIRPARSAYTVVEPSDIPVYHSTISDRMGGWKP